VRVVNGTVQLKDPIRREAEREQPPAFPEVSLYAVVALAAVVIFALRWGFSFSARDLIDTDGYMRFLRVQDLMDGGDWFNARSARSNFPFGETLHWTRPLDAIVAAGALLLSPFLGDSALYVSAVGFGPLSLILLGAAVRWAFGELVPAASRAVLLPGLLALPVVVGYMVPGRLDHHALLFVLFVLTVGGTLRVSGRPGGLRDVVVGATLALGLWISPEFLVPVALVAVTLGVTVSRSDSPNLAKSAVRIFATAAGGTLLAVFLERGPGWAEIDFARVSVVHAFLLAMIGIAFGAFVLVVRDSWRSARRLGLVAAASLMAGGVVLAVFPKLLGGPFVDFHPLVKERWLYLVVELQSVVDWGPSGIALHLVWPLLAILAGGRMLSTAKEAHGPWLVITYLWMLAYVALSFYQVRWATFAQLLAVPLLVASLAPLYRRLQSMRSAVLVRPLLIAVVIAAVLAAGPGLAEEPAASSGGEASCELKAVMPVLAAFPVTTLLAEQDVGPEVLYRTDLNVVATPYGNEQAFLYTLEVMAERDVDSVPELLARRDVGLILVCPGRIDIMRPEDTSATFYEALVVGPRPDFVQPVPLPEETDYLLFSVED
jgi:hypothetical protein